MKVLFVVMSILVIVLNVLSATDHAVLKEAKKGFRYSVITINSNDTLCAIFMSVLWIADIFYGEKLSIKQTQWKSNLFCFLCFGIVVIFTILSQGLLVFLGIQRLDMVVRPMDSAFRQTSLVLKLLSFQVGVSFMFSVMITLLVVFISQSLPTTLCLPFVDPTKSFLSIKLTTWFTCISQTMTTFGLLYIHVSLVSSLKKAQVSVAKSKKKDDNTYLIIQLVFLTVSTIFCWFPTNIVFLMAMFISEFSTKTVIWMVVAVMPINSILNPLIFLAYSVKKLYKQCLKY